nr:hypothetical protein KPHV_48060 [Kitasatospora purpeofusca]
MVNLEEWLGAPDLTAPAHHVAELGLLAHELHTWERGLTADGHPDMPRPWGPPEPR